MVSFSFRDGTPGRSAAVIVRRRAALALLAGLVTLTLASPVFGQGGASIEGVRQRPAGRRAARRHRDPAQRGHRSNRGSPRTAQTADIGFLALAPGRYHLSGEFVRLRGERTSAMSPSHRPGGESGLHDGPADR